MPSEWSLPAAIDAVTATVPDREMLVWKSVRRTYADVQDRTRRLGAFFAAQGLGLRRERAELARWECGQSRVAILLSNCPEYVETMLGAYRARAVPFNVNHHYNPVEVEQLLDQIGAEAVVYHRRLAPLLVGAQERADRLLVHIDDGSEVEPRPGSIAFEATIATRRSRRAPGAVPRRPLPRVHRRHHWPPEGRAMASGRRVRRRDGRRG